jgi:hypothetical protein
MANAFCFPGVKIKVSIVPSPSMSQDNYAGSGTCLSDLEYASLTRIALLYGALIEFRLQND